MSFIIFVILSFLMALFAYMMNNAEFSDHAFAGLFALYIIAIGLFVVG